MAKDIVREFQENPRRWIHAWSKVSTKTRKRKFGIIQKFLLFCKKQEKISKMPEITEENLMNFLEKIKTSGIYNKNTKKFEKLSEATLKDYENVIKNFIQKVKILK